MKLNIDCVRDIMLWAEENSDLRHPAIYIDTVLSKSLRLNLNCLHDMTTMSSYTTLNIASEQAFWMNLLLQTVTASAYQI